jgi:hypothetical protein
MAIKKESILKRLNEVEQLTIELLDKMPNDNDLIDLKRGLKRIVENVKKEWPLSASEKRRVDIGMFAMRELEGGPYGELPDLLMKLNTYITEPDEVLREFGINPDNV